jgi:hypothetical protein
MTASSILLSTILLVHAALSSPSPTAPRTIPVSTSAELARLAAARPDALKVDMRAEPNHLTITAKFRLKGSHMPGSLNIDLWSRGDEAIVESRFSVRGSVHLTARQVHGSVEHQVWMSPTLETEIERNAPQLRLAYLALLTDPELLRQIKAGLGTLPTDPLAGNPACGVTKWGLKALVWIANAACCAGGFGVACLACVVGTNSAQDAINDGIDCNKECKPDCPVS